MKRRTFAVLLLAAMGLIVCAQWLAAAEPVVENLEFVEADLRDVFRSLALAGRYNVLLTKDVQGTVTIPFQERITVRDAICLIARTYEYDFRWIDERTVVIGKEATLQQNFGSKELTKVITLSYAGEDQIEQALKVVIDTAKQFSKNTRTHQVVVRASELQMDNVLEIVAQMDRPSPQVNIELRLEEISEDSLDDLGIEWNLRSVGAEMNAEITQAGFAITPTARIGLALNALESKGKATLLSKPNVSCLDSEEAEIFYGSSEPVGTRTLDEAGHEVWKVTYMDIGTKLTVQARLNAENIVTVKVTAEVSSALPKPRSIGGSEYPVIVKRSTESMARLKDGETFVLGGLTRREEGTSKTGLPLLSRIPLLGALFGKKNTTIKSLVMCIFITPHIQQLPAGQSPVETKPPVPPGAETSQVPAIAEPAPGTGSTPVETGGAAEGTAEAGTAEAAPAGGAGPGEAAADAAGPTAVTPESYPVSTPAAASLPGTTGIEAGGQSIEELAEAAAQAGDTAAPAAAAPVTPAGTAVTKPALLRPEDIRHLPYHVKKGETLALISRKFGVPWQVIAIYNKLDKKAVLQPGQVLMVPIPESYKYVVKPKETLWRIAKRYGVSVELLVEINGLADAAKIEVGQVIVLPCSVDRIVNKAY